MAVSQAQVKETSDNDPFWCPDCKEWVEGEGVMNWHGWEVQCTVCGKEGIEWKTARHVCILTS